MNELLIENQSLHIWGGGGGGGVGGWDIVPFSKFLACLCLTNVLNFLGKLTL